MATSKTDVRIAELDKTSFTQEAIRIQQCALRGDTRAVRLGPVIFFCANRDAWMLDPEDHLARCLAREGQTIPLGITENRKQFGVEWNARYEINGELFQVADDSGSVRGILGYPVHELVLSS
ncbi:MAG: hypothetical protein MUF81_00075 [Verrucomicrobia bacterium]|jgi:hypothetical protein|nr:hypothetical protein [Verrucomicrobiota bacterium]